MKAAALAALACCTLPAAAQTTVGINHGIDNLSGPAANWHETSLSVRHQAAPRLGFGAGVTRIERFGIGETQFSAGADVPLSERLTLRLTATSAATTRSWRVTRSAQHCSTNSPKAGWCMGEGAAAATTTSTSTRAC